MKQHNIFPILILLMLLAFGLRVWQIDSAPPGLRVDELSNSFVVSQRVLDGRPTFFFPEASGHEALWHVLQAGFIHLFGYSALALRAASIFLGTLTIPLTFAVGRVLFGRNPATLAAAGVTVSFWSLMYSRVATRHIAAPVFILVGFYWFLRAQKSNRIAYWIAAGVGTGLALHTYFAGWVAPAVIGAFCVYWLLFDRPTFVAQLRGMAVWLAVTIAFAVPVLLGIRAMPEVETEGRISVVAGPLQAAREGDFSIVLEHLVTTLGMVHANGDPEWLYNVPFRPIFLPFTAAVFWLGILIALFQIIRHRFTKPAAPYIFLLGWWFTGLAPAFISVPPSSYGHTIAAQSATYLILALPVTLLPEFPGNRDRIAKGVLHYCIWMAILIPVLNNDIFDYFGIWPDRGNTRFLYHADQHNVGDYLHENPQITDFSITGLMDGNWENYGLQVYAPANVRPRRYNPQRAVILNPPLSFMGYPVVETAFDDLFAVEKINQVAGYQLREIAEPLTPTRPLICFQNNLCILDATYNTPLLDITWWVDGTPDLPPRPINSFPPVPGSYEGLHISTFAHLWNADGEWLTGDDGWWVEPDHLQPGDIFRQRHILIPPDGTATTIAIGLYDPLTGTRTLTRDGLEQVTIPLP